MITREEKNKEYIDEINKEKVINISKKVFHFFGIVLLLFFLVFVYIYYFGIKGLKVNEYVIKDSNIPKSFHGVKIMHFSDLLYGSTIHQNEIDKLEEKILLINPDIVIFTGNIINKDYKITESEIKYLNNFFNNIPYTIGKYAVKGNYDNPTFDLIMENTKFDILDNELINVYNNTDEYIDIIGLSNLLSENLEIQKKDGEYSISLINNYDNYHMFYINSNIVCAGHNLGGEIRIFNYPLLKNGVYNNSYYEEKDSKIYISNGLGSLHHMRLMNHPSINVYRLYTK